MDVSWGLAGTGGGVVVGPNIGMDFGFNQILPCNVWSLYAVVLATIYSGAHMATR
jgi:hypothetical protein